MKSYISMILAAMCIGTIGVLVKLVGSDVPGPTIAFFRLFFGLIFIALIVKAVDKTVFDVTKSEMKMYGLTGFFFAVGLSVFIIANTYGPVSNIVIINQVGVIGAVTVLSFIFLSERVTKAQITALIIGTVGLLIINPLEPGFIKGNILSIIAGFSGGTTIVLLRYTEKNHNLGVIFWQLLFGTIFLIPLPLIYGLGNPLQKLPYLIALGVISTGLGYLLLEYTLRFRSADFCSITNGIISPLTATILGVILLSEIPSKEVLIGGTLLIIAGVIITKKG